jgi:hypothetical protein
MRRIMPLYTSKANIMTYTLSEKFLLNHLRPLFERLGIYNELPIPALECVPTGTGTYKYSESQLEYGKAGWLMQSSNWLVGKAVVVIAANNFDAAGGMASRAELCHSYG